MPLTPSPAAIAATQVSRDPSAAAATAEAAHYAASVRQGFTLPLQDATLAKQGAYAATVNSGSPDGEGLEPPSMWDRASPTLMPNAAPDAGPQASPRATALPQASPRPVTGPQVCPQPKPPTPSAPKQLQVQLSDQSHAQQQRQQRTSGQPSAAATDDSPMPNAKPDGEPPAEQPVGPHAQAADQPPAAFTTVSAAQLPALNASQGSSNAQGSSSSQGAGLPYAEVPSLPAHIVHLPSVSTAAAKAVASDEPSTAFTGVKVTEAHLTQAPQAALAADRSASPENTQTTTGAPTIRESKEAAAEPAGSGKSDTATGSVQGASNSSSCDPTEDPPSSSAEGAVGFLPADESPGVDVVAADGEPGDHVDSSADAEQPQKSHEPLKQLASNTEASPDRDPAKEAVQPPTRMPESTADSKAEKQAHASADSTAVHADVSVGSKPNGQRSGQSKQSSTAIASTPGGRPRRRAAVDARTKIT